MNILYKTMIAGLTMLSIGSAAMAAPTQETPHPRAYAETKFDPVKRAERIEQRQQKLHDALKLAPHQEAAWKTYIAAVTPQQPVGRVDRASFKEMNATQRAEKRLEMSKARVARQETRVAALKTFYATLTPEQRQVFDGHSAHGPRKGHHHRHG